MSYQTRLDLACGLRLTQHFFSWDEMRWIFEGRFHWSDEADPHTSKIINEWKLLVDFKGGHLMPRFKVSMHVIVPERLGKQYFLGVDISPGAKTFLEFYYERPEPVVARPTGETDPYWKGIPPQNIPRIPGPFYLAEISQGARPPIDVRALTAEHGPGLVKPIEVNFPFPIADRIPWHHGYQIPFLDDNFEVAQVVVPESLIKPTLDQPDAHIVGALPLDPQGRRLLTD